MVDAPNGSRVVRHHRRVVGDRAGNRPPRLNMRRVLLVHPSIQPPGGSNGVAAWMLQALVRQHRVTVLTWRPVEVDPINRFFGTSLRASDFDRLLAPRSWRAAIDSLPVPAALLRSALL